MGKWLALAAIGLLILLAILWRQLQPVAIAATEAAPAPAPATPSASAPKPAAEPVAPAPPEPAAPAQPKKIDPDSDAFYTNFLDVVPAQLSRSAAKCYDGIAKRVTRNNELSVKYKLKVKNGDVTISGVTVVKNTLNNPSLETCFIQEMLRTSWHDDTLPDWESEDELALQPERGLKKYLRDNIDYVGAEAPRN